MKKSILLLVFVLGVTTLSAQGFYGKEDSKFQVGATFQDNGSGIAATYDYGLGQNISVGVLAGYILGVNKEIDSDFGDRIDLRARFNANIGGVFGLGDNADIYPGLNLSLKQFGGHLGGRYFFTDGFGVFVEMSTPFARYDNADLTPAELLNNQFVFALGAVFNLY